MGTKIMKKVPMGTRVSDEIIKHWQVSANCYFIIQSIIIDHTPLHEAFSSSGRLTGDWPSRVSNLAHLNMISGRVQKDFDSFTCSFLSQPHGWWEEEGVWL